MNGDNILIKIIPCDEQPVEIPYKYVRMMPTLKNILDDLPDSSVMSIPLPIEWCTSKIMLNIADYCKYIDDHPSLNMTKILDKRDTLNDKWLRQFYDELGDAYDVLRLCHAADYLGLTDLYDLSCKIFAHNYIRGKTMDELTALKKKLEQ